VPSSPQNFNTPTHSVSYLQYLQAFARHMKNLKI